MSQEESWHTRLSNVAAHWNILEERLKEAEQFREETMHAAINEMRYAGRRIVDVIDRLNGNGGQFDQESRDDLVIAETYLVNADHDITDGICYYAHKRLRRVIEFHGVEKLRSLVTNFDAFYPEILSAQTVIRGSRRERQQRRKEYSDLAKNYVPKIIDFTNKTRGIVDLRLPDDLPAQLDILQKNVRTVTWIAFLGSIASILGLVLALWLWFTTPAPTTPQPEQTAPTQELRNP